MVVPESKFLTWPVKTPPTPNDVYVLTTDDLGDETFQLPTSQIVEAMEQITPLTRSWQDEQKVREIGKAIREHTDRFGGGTAAAERQRAQQLDGLTLRRSELLRESRRISVFSVPAGPERDAVRRKQKKLTNEIDKVRGEIAALNSRSADVEQLQKVLREVRPGFGEGSFRRKGQRMTDGMRWAEVSAGFFPREWVEASMAAGDIKLNTRGGRGFYQHNGSFSKRTGGWEATVKADNQQTMTHDLGHRMQYAARGGGIRGSDITKRVDAAAKQFHERRTREAGTSVRKLSQILPGHGYRSDEVANDDRYYHAYVGREYGGDPKEVWTMGLEAVWHRNRYNNLQIKQTDPELWDLIVGILAGVP